MTIPQDCELIRESAPFVGRDEDRWFIMQNFDYEDHNGNLWMTTEIISDPLGYDDPLTAEIAISAQFWPIP